MTPTQCLRLCVLWSKKYRVPLTAHCRFRFTGRRRHATCDNQLLQEVLYAVLCYYNLEGLIISASTAWFETQLAGLKWFTFLLQRYQGEGQEIFIWQSGPHPSSNGLLALYKKNKYQFFNRKKTEWKFLTELPGTGSSEHTHCPSVTKDLLPPLLPPAAISAPNSNLSPLQTPTKT